MPRRPRNAPGGLVYHVLNRAVARLALFEQDAVYQAVERVLAEAWRCWIAAMMTVPSQAAGRFAGEETGMVLAQTTISYFGIIGRSFQAAATSHESPKRVRIGC